MEMEQSTDTTLSGHAACREAIPRGSYATFRRCGISSRIKEVRLASVADVPSHLFEYCSAERST